MDTATTKLCSRCKRQLDASDFHKSSKRKDGLQAYCKDCHRLASGRTTCPRCQRGKSAIKELCKWCVLAIKRDAGLMNGWKGEHYD